MHYVFYVPRILQTKCPCLPPPSRPGERRRSKDLLSRLVREMVVIISISQSRSLVYARPGLSSAAVAVVFVAKDEDRESPKL